MNGKMLKKIVPGAAVLGILLIGGGCMWLPHPGHGGSGQGHGHAAAEPQSAAPEAEAGTEADRPSSGAEESAAAALAAHHGPVDPRSPWAWLAGGGMVLMMVLMIL